MTAIVQAAVRAPKPFNRKRIMTDVPKPVAAGAGGRKVPQQWPGFAFGGKRVVNFSF